MKKIAGPIDWPLGFRERAEAWADTPAGMEFFLTEERSILEMLQDPEFRDKVLRMTSNEKMK
jgi:hypothetical protein